jgi:hypothetical protein
VEVGRVMVRRNVDEEICLTLRLRIPDSAEQGAGG